MADQQVVISGHEASPPITVVDNDTALTSFTLAPAYSDKFSIAGAGQLSIYVTPVPETAHAIKLAIQASPNGSDWFTVPDNVVTDMADQVWTWNAATAAAPAHVIEPLYGAGRWARFKYGFSGGTGAGASLTIVVQGRVL